MYKSIVLLVLGILFCTATGSSATVVTLGWDPNTESNLAGYKLYYGPTPRTEGAYTDTVVINDKGVTTWDLDLDLSQGTYYLALTAFDTDGNESGFSNEVEAKMSSSGEPPGQPGQPMLVQ